jgi:predicted Zn-dependent protease
MSMATRLESLLSFLEKDPEDSFTRYAVALELISKGDNSEGERYLRETIKRDAAYIPAYHQLGQLLGKFGTLDDAVAAYQAGIKAAAAQGEHHARSEMEQELEELQDEN